MYHYIVSNISQSTSCARNKEANETWGKGGCISMHHFTQYCPVLTQESALFMDQASSILRTLSRVVSSFSDEQQQLAARRMLQKTHRPQHISTSLRKHDWVKHIGAVTSNKQFNISPLVSLEAQLLFL